MRIFGASPWTRTAIANLTADELEAIDAMLPDGMTVTLGAARRPGNWTVFLIATTAAGHPEQVYRLDGVWNIPAGVQTAVNRWRAAA